MNVFDPTSSEGVALSGGVPLFLRECGLAGSWMSPALNPDLETTGYTFSLGHTFWRKCVIVGVGFEVSYTQDTVPVDFLSPSESRRRTLSASTTPACPLPGSAMMTVDGTSQTVREPPSLNCFHWKSCRGQGISSQQWKPYLRHWGVLVLHSCSHQDTIVSS